MGGPVAAGRTSAAGQLLAAGRAADGLLAERTRINFSWLHKLRWAGLAGQLLTIFIVRDAMGIALPWPAMLSIIAVAAATNLALGAWLYCRRQSAWPRWLVHGEWLLGSIMMLDNLLLTALLYESGGPMNPFTIFYLVNISLAAVVLKARWAWVLDGAAFLCFALLFAVYRPLPQLEHGAHVEAAAGGAAACECLDSQLAAPVDPHAGHRHLAVVGEPMSLHLRGMLIAFGGAATFIVYFITRVTTELARREAELSEARRQQAQTEKLEALATLAAGAAHELASPLSTVAVVSRDLELELDADPSSAKAAADARLIRSEVDRCRRILDAMAAGAGESVGEELVEFEPLELIRLAIGELNAADRLTITSPPEHASGRIRVPRVAMCQSLRAIVQNALDASPADQPVRIGWAREGDALAVTVVDQGEGMAGDVLRRAGEPFFTTKEPGAGMGLGLFLARRVVERLGGSVSLDSKLSVGTQVYIRLPLAQPAPLPGRPAAV